MLLRAVTPFKKRKSAEMHRDSNIELLRILAILGVVILHYNNESIGGGLQYVHRGSVNEIVLLFLEGLCICAVDLFIIISGFFSCNSNKRNIVKIVNLLAQYSVFQMFRYFINVISEGTFSWYSMLRTMMPVNYFIILYVVLYLISPYINIMIKQLSKPQLKKCIGLLFCLFSIFPTIVSWMETIIGPLNGLSSIGISGNDNGYTIVNFMLMYTIGAGIRFLDFKLQRKMTAIIILINSVIIALWGSIIPSLAWEYSNPLVILNAVFIFLLFKEFKIRSLHINKLSKASFTCFCIHLTILENCYYIQESVQSNIFYMLGHIGVVCIGTYVVSYIVYKIWDIISTPILLWIEKLFINMKVDFSVKEE